MADPMWRGRRIADPDHAVGLEVDAATRQFRDHLPEDDAVDAAHAAYAKNRALESAAHHLAGMRAAHAAGWDDVAREHAGAYAAAAGTAGFDHTRAPPQEVLDRLAGLSPIYKFKKHPADEIWRRDEPVSSA